MGEKIAGFFSNDSPFGQFMIRVGILIVSSILFAVTPVPIVTIGPGLAALFGAIGNSVHSARSGRRSRRIFVRHFLPDLSFSRWLFSFMRISGSAAHRAGLMHISDGR